MQLAAALAAQRQREAAVLAESYARRRAAKAEVMQLLAERKKHLAERLKERSAAVRAAAAGAPAAAVAASPGDVPGAAERREEGEVAKEAAEGTGEAAAAEAQGVARPAVQLNLLVRADVQVGAGKEGVYVGVLQVGAWLMLGTGVRAAVGKVNGVWADVQVLAPWAV